MYCFETFLHGVGHRRVIYHLVYPAAAGEANSGAPSLRMDREGGRATSGRKEVRVGLREPGGDLEGARAPGTAPRRPPPPPPQPPGRAPAALTRCGCAALASPIVPTVFLPFVICTRIVLFVSEAAS